MKMSPEELNKMYVTEGDLKLTNARNERKINYPSIQEQLDMLWHGMNDNPTLRIEPFYSTIKSIKDQFPKE